MTEKKEQVNRKKMKGKVVSIAMDKTIVVSVSRFVKHPKYGKYIMRSKRYKAHVEGEKPALGSMVTIEETRPISKQKKFRLVSAE